LAKKEYDLILLLIFSVSITGGFSNVLSSSSRVSSWTTSFHSSLRQEKRCSTPSQKASDNCSACHHFDGAWEEIKDADLEDADLEDADLEDADTEYSSDADEDSEYIPDETEKLILVFDKKEMLPILFCCYLFCF
jgi:hypothetical protein